MRTTSWAWLPIALLVFISDSAAQAETRPNVLFIAIDDPRPQIGCDGGKTVRTERYRLTRWLLRDNPTKIEAVELYDHQVDPQENQNIADAPENQELVRQLGKQMDAGWKGSLAK